MLQAIDSGIIPISLPLIRAGLFSGCSVRKASDATAQDFTGAPAIAWDTEIFDIGGWHEGVTNPSRLTVPSGLGITKVLVVGNLILQNITFPSFLIIKKNGSAVFDGAAAQGHPALSGVDTNEMTVSNIINCTAGDFFQLAPAVVTDTSVTVLAAQSNFSIMAVG